MAANSRVLSPHQALCQRFHVTAVDPGTIDTRDRVSLPPGAILRIVKYLVVSLVSAHLIPEVLHSPNCGNPKYLQTLPNVPWRGLLVYMDYFI
jgi:hypothetical protein